VEYGSQLLTTNTSISGAQNAIVSRNNDGYPLNIVTVDGGSLTATTGDVFQAYDTNSQLTVKNGTVITAGDGNLLNVTSTDPSSFSSTVNFLASGITATGNIISDAASTANVNLANGTTITGTEQNTYTTVDPTSTWIMNGNSDIRALTLAGTARFTPPATGSDPALLANYKTLTVQNYTGQNGTMVFNTYLAGDGAASDRLIINTGGTATGHTFAQINNTGGLGALTVGNGILVVQALPGATTDAGAFTLAGPVSAGAYTYTLNQGGIAGSDPYSWYLRDTLTPVPPVPPTPPTPPTPPAPPVIPIPFDVRNPLESTVQFISAIQANPGAVVVPVAYKSLPNYRQEVPVYMVAPALAEHMGRDMLGTYHDRVGEDHPGDPHGNVKDGNTVTPDVADHDMLGWLRVFGELGHTGFGKGASDFSTQGPSYDYGIDGLQIGFDALRHTAENGLRHIAGLYGGYMHAFASVNQVYNSSRAGSVDMDGYSLGAYYTLKGQRNWYVDAVLQGTWYVNGEARSTLGNKIHPNGFGLAASLESGYPIALGHQWAVEPQAQIIYQWDQLNNDSDQFGRVKYHDITAWTGRLGARLTKDWTTQSGKKGTVWARVNLWHQLGDDSARTTFTNTCGQYPVSLRTSLGDTWVQMGLGISGQLTKRLSAFVSADFNQYLGNNNGQSLSGRAALRYEF